MRDSYLFVYGTLRRSIPGSRFYLIADRVEFVDFAWVYGRLYALGDYPGLVRSPSFRSRVRGEIYRLRNPRQVMRLLDDYEGCGRRHRRPHEYRRERVCPSLENGGRVRAWCYVYARTPRGLQRIRSGDYAGWIASCKFRGAKMKRAVTKQS